MKPIICLLVILAFKITASADRCIFSIEPVHTVYEVHEHGLIYPVVNDECFQNGKEVKMCVIERSKSSNNFLSSCNTFNASSTYRDSKSCVGPHRLHSIDSFTCKYKKKGVKFSNVSRLPVITTKYAVSNIVESKVHISIASDNQAAELHEVQFSFYPYPSVHRDAELNPFLIIEVNQPVAKVVQTFCKRYNLAEEACYNALITSFCHRFINKHWYTTCDAVGKYILDHDTVSDFVHVIEPLWVPQYMEHVKHNGVHMIVDEPVDSSLHICVVIEGMARQMNLSVHSYTSWVANLHKKYNLSLLATPALGRLHQRVPQLISANEMFDKSKNSDNLDYYLFQTKKLQMTFIQITNSLNTGQSRSIWALDADVIYLSQNQVFNALLSLYNSSKGEFYRPCLQWLIIIDNDAYVNVSALKRKLDDYNPHRPLYLGNPITLDGNTTAMSCNFKIRYPLRWENAPLNVPFAGFSGGAVLSRGLLDLLVTRIRIDTPPSDHGYNHANSYCFASTMNDARLGGCIHSELGLSLTPMVGLGRKYAPACDSWCVEDTEDEISLRHAGTNQHFCKNTTLKINESRWKNVLGGVLVAAMTYEGNRDTSQAFVRHLQNTLAEDDRPNFKAREQVIVYEDKTGSEEMYKENEEWLAGIVKVENECHYISPSRKAAQGRFMRALIDLGDRAEKNPSIQIIAFFDCDISVNLDALLRYVEKEYYDYSRDGKAFALGDDWHIASPTGILAGGWIFSREAIVRIRDYLIKFSDETGKFPLEYACDDIQIPVPGLSTAADSFVAYLTRRINITRRHVRGIHAISAACVLPTNYLNLPIISMHGFAADQHERVQRWYQSQNEHDRNRKIISTSLAVEEALSTNSPPAPINYEDEVVILKQKISDLEHQIKILKDMELR
jgi:hypothetical protein